VEDGWSRALASCFKNKANRAIIARARAKERKRERAVRQIHHLSLSLSRSSSSDDANSKQREFVKRGKKKKKI